MERELNNQFIMWQRQKQKERVLEKIIREPGLDLNQLLKELDIHKKAVREELENLEKQQDIVVIERKQVKYYYPVGGYNGQIQGPS